MRSRVRALPRRSRPVPRSARADDRGRIPPDRPGAATRRPAPLFVLTGGDPMRRPDLAISSGTRRRCRSECGAHAEWHGRGDLPSSGSRNCKTAGLKRVAVSLDGPDAERTTHSAG